MKKKINDEFELYDLKVETVRCVKGKKMVCSHSVGSYFLLSGENLTIPNGQSFPIYPLAAILPLLPVKQRMTHQYDWISTDSEIACPDPNCGGIFEIKRVGKRIFRHSEVTIVSLNNQGVE